MLIYLKWRMRWQPATILYFSTSTKKSQQQQNNYNQTWKLLQKCNTAAKLRMAVATMKAKRQKLQLQHNGRNII